MTNTEVVHVAITFADDSLGVMQFVTAEYDARRKLRWMRRPIPELVEAEIARTAWEPGKAPVKGWRFLAGPADLPADRAYRDAWVDRDGAIVHDMPRAREVHRNQIRALRRPALQDLDGEWMRATGRGDAAEAALVEARRQILRDLPASPAIEAAQSAADLLAAWPLELKR